MGHTHEHGSQASYYVEQIVTIAACGAIAGVCILLYVNGTSLNGMLKSDQHLRVLFGGVGLLILVLIRAAYVWIAAGKASATAASNNHAHDHEHAQDHHHDHAHCDHDHKHDHDHDHAHCDHDHGHKPEAAVAAGAHDHSHDDHGHDHSHGLAPWRFALLLLPVVLFLLGLPAAGGMVAVNQRDDSGRISDVGNVSGKGNNFTIGFNTLEMASRNPEVRDSIAGSTVQLKGMYRGENAERFTLVRFKINCCAADALPLKAVIMIDPAKTGKFKVDPAKYTGKWVQVTGQLQFSKLGKEIVPTIILSPESQSELETEMVKEIPPDNNPYAND